MQKKSDDFAVQFGEKANEQVKQKNYFEALINYNRSLCFAETSSQLSVTFANRSSVFLENKQYEIALNNIEIARDLDPYSTKFSHLNESYKKCMKMIRAKRQWLTSPKPPDEDPKKLINLSYPKNPKIPFVVDRINVKNSKDGGKNDKYLYATEPLKAGDVIAVETSMINLITEADRYKRCCWCASSNSLDLIPCLHTASLMFCSIKCRRATYKKMPLHTLESLVDDSNGTNPLIFAGKFKEYLHSGCLFDYNLSSIKEYNDDLRKLLVLCNIKKRENGQEPYTKIFHFTYHQQLLNYGFSLIGSLISHSCNPNVAVLGIDNKFAFYVCRPIARGETLEICYGTEYFYMSRSMRNRQLYDLCGIICTCEACYMDYPVTLPKREMFIQSIIVQSPDSFRMVTKKLQFYFNIINKGGKGEKSKELCVAQDMVWQLMQEVGHYITYGYFGPLFNKTE